VAPVELAGLEQIARHVEALDAEIETVIAADEKLARCHDILTSIAGLGTLTANQIIATMPELGSLDNKQAASLAGLSPSRASQAKGKASPSSAAAGLTPPGPLHARFGLPRPQGKIRTAHRHRQRSAQG
jgi:transposase